MYNFKDERRVEKKRAHNLYKHNFVIVIILFVIIDIFLLELFISKQPDMKISSYELYPEHLIE